MERYLYDLHVHTHEVSKCAASTGAEVAEYLKSLGYSGFVVTDHFFKSNCRVPIDIPWHDMVDGFCEGYYAAKKRGDEIGIDVFFGWEYSREGHFLTLGFTPEWMHAHPDLHLMNEADYFRLVKSEGGLMIHAHPFHGKESLHLFPGLVEGVEVFNASKQGFPSDMAYAYAKRYGLIEAGGSDMHITDCNATSGVALDRKVSSCKELADALRERKHLIIQNNMKPGGKPGDKD